MTQEGQASAGDHARRISEVHLVASCEWGRMDGPVARDQRRSCPARIGKGVFSLEELLN